MTILLNTGMGANTVGDDKEDVSLALDPNKRYLGEEPVDLTTDPTFSDHTTNDWVLYWLFSYGQIDGEHHKKWVLDQIARIVLGTPVVGKIARWDNGFSEYRISLGEPSQAYRDWVEEYLERDENGKAQYDYDAGIAP